jgi:hypothetical protein
VRRAILPLTLLVLALVPAQAQAQTSPYPPVRGNPADRLVSFAIDPYGYDYSRRCLKRPQAGALALQDWLERNAGGTFWGIMRCSKLGRGNYSLHAEGRAIDWHLNAHSSRDRREATRLIELLLATDRAGNPHALARRMGIQEIIWNCRSWWSGSLRMGRYSVCYDGKGRKKRVSDTLAHRDHIHFGLNWSGARKRSSFWKHGN